MLKDVLLDAVARTFQETSRNLVTSDNEVLYLWTIRNAWLRSLRQAFSKHYPTTDDPSSFATYGGRPGSGELRQRGVPTGIRQWAPRWEFLYDVAVLKVARINAAFATATQVPLATKAVWLVESEIAGDGTQVAEDVSKLQIGRAENTLLIAAQTGQYDKQKWLQFLGRTLQGIDGRVFLALLPSYAAKTAGAKSWLNQDIDISLYQCVLGGQMPELIESLHWPPDGPRCHGPETSGG